MRVIDIRNTELPDLDSILPRPKMGINAAQEVVQPIIEQVRQGGAAALRELSEKFDSVVPASIRVPRQKMLEALAAQPAEVTNALTTAITNARVAHEAQLPTESVTEVVPGGFVYQRWVPMRRVGLYVPGGLAVYPSSVVMNVVAAQVAGVDSLVVASPPQKDNDGYPHPSILAACELLGVEEVIAVGGAQAIAAMAFGFQDEDYDCQGVDIVTGPGNIYVAAAKRSVRGICGIDSEAGTTEIAVLADQFANPQFVAADLISQAEHDPAAASLLITDSEDLIEKVQEAILEQVPKALHSERIETALNGPQSGIVLTPNIQIATEVVERYAPEHLEVVTTDALQRSLMIRNAGAIFVGDYSPVPLGDYVAGSNHVLPTGGTARFSSGLNSTTYLRSLQVVDYDQNALGQLTDALVVLSETEGLPAHGAAATHRREPASPPKLESDKRLMELQLPVREDLRPVEPYGAPQLDVPVRLNVNENPHAPSDEVVETIVDAVRGASKRLNRYADRDASELRSALAKYVSMESGVAVSADDVWAANGSNEIMLQLLQAFGGPGRTALVETPTYSMYREYARDTFTDFCEAPGPKGFFSSGVLIEAMRKNRPAVVFVPSPNNPTGTQVSIEDLKSILEAARITGPLRRFPIGEAQGERPETGRQSRATIVVVDEAYAEFRDPGTPSALELLAENPHLVVTRTMSKAFAAAGLRLGYMVAGQEITREVMKVRLPYHLSLVTQAAALATLDSAQSQLEQVGSIRSRRENLAKTLRARGYDVFPSASNFLLFGPFEDRGATWKQILDRGVLIREVGPAGYLRVTVGTDQENQRFLEALEETR